jgi:hypothetical protein
LIISVREVNLFFKLVVRPEPLSQFNHVCFRTARITTAMQTAKNQSDLTAASK